MYAAGFLVLTLYLAKFGITELNLLRPRILSTGVLFLLLTAIPIFSVSTMFALFGLSKPPMPGSRTVQHQGLLKLQISFFFYLVCFGLAIPSVFLLGNLKSVRSPGLNLCLLLFAPALIVAILTNYVFDRFRYALTIGTFLTSGAIAAVVVRYADRGFLWLTVWYYAVGLITVIVYYAVRDPSSRRGLQWEVAPFWLIGLLSFYVLQVYGNMLPQFGGGKPRPVVMYFSTKIPAVDSDSAEVMLLEETDQGYYILLQADEKTAFFVRRDLVAAVRFGHPVKEPNPAIPAKQP